jgi:hypothetical protein
MLPSSSAQTLAHSIVHDRPSDTAVAVWFSGHAGAVSGATSLIVRHFLCRNDVSKEPQFADWFSGHVPAILQLSHASTQKHHSAGSFPNALSLEYDIGFKTAGWAIRKEFDFE